MDSSRIILLVAVGVFLAYLLVKLRPKPPLSDSEPRPRRLPEDRLYKRIRRLPPDAQERLIDRLRADLDEDEPDADD
jgi:hypothetical protein